MTSGFPLERVRAAKPKAAAVFRDLVGEVAVGIAPLGDGLFGLKVNLTVSPAPEVELPREVDGVPVVVEVVGPIRKRGG